MLGLYENDESKTILWRQYLDFKQSVSPVRGEIASGVGIERTHLVRRQRIGVDPIKRNSGQLEGGPGGLRGLDQGLGSIRER